MNNYKVILIKQKTYIEFNRTENKGILKHCWKDEWDIL